LKMDARLIDGFIPFLEPLPAGPRLQSSQRDADRKDGLRDGVGVNYYDRRVKDTSPVGVSMDPWELVWTLVLFDDNQPLHII
jgi:hypothetical protein